MKKCWIYPILTLILILTLCVPALAEGESGRIFDTVELLSDKQWQTLEAEVEQITQRYDCGVYLAIVDNYETYGPGSIYQVTTQIYNDPENHLGVGSERDGILLLMSMYGRDYALFVHGKRAEFAFSDHAQELLEEKFLDNFEENDWYGGFCDYLETCQDYLAKADAGEPVRQSPMLYILCSIGASVFVAFVVCMTGKAKMRTVHQKVEANAYVAGDIHLTDRQDQFTHTTETRRRIEKSSSGSSRSESGGGGSGRSGKF